MRLSAAFLLEIRMSNKLSHSSLSKFQTCPKAYYYRYIRKLYSKYKSAALFFGSALDEAVNDLLDPNKEVSRDEAVEIFYKNWEIGKDSSGEEIELKHNETITYSASDFDSDLLQKDDYRKLFKFLEENNMVDDIFGELDRIKKLKSEKGWDNLESIDRQFYNYANWLSMRNKGVLLLDGYIEQILPHIDEVIEVQKYVTLENDSGDIIRGYIDLIAKWEDGSICVLDNKTSGIEYAVDSVIKSPQLSTYMMILNDKALDPDDEWEHKVEKAGYLVLRKNLIKDIKKVCKQCGHKAKKGARHKTCDNEIDGVRCGGPWDRSVTFKVDTQIIIDPINDHVQDLVLQNINDINNAIKNELFIRNFNSCMQPWGKCEYYDKCWFNNEEQLITKGE